MRFIAIPLLLSAWLYGQGQEPVKVVPGTPAVKAPVEAAPAPAPAALPPATIAADKVVVEVNGRKITKAELDELLQNMPPQIVQAVRTRPENLSQVFLMQRLSEDAAQAGLDKVPPFKEQLEFTRLQILSTAALTNHSNNISVSPDDAKKIYEEHPEKFKEVKVRVIYVAFNPKPAKSAAAGKALPTEAEAQAKITDLRRQLEGGADFGKLARDNSDDAASAAKDGDFGVIKSDSSYPEQIKKAVFQLKQGEISEPLKEPNGFYLIRAEEISTQPYTEVLTHILEDLKKERFQEWMKGMQSQYTVKIDDPAYFSPQVPAQLQQVH